MAYYVQLDADYWDHPKTLKLIELLGPRGESIPLKMWSWAARFKVSGVFDSVAQLAIACRFRGQAETVQTALKSAGFIDPDGLTIHDWTSRTGHGIAMYEKEKERQRLKAERIRAEKEAQNNGGMSHGTNLGTSQGNPSVRTTITGPDLTGPDRTEPEQLPPSPRGVGSRSRRKARKNNADLILEAAHEGDRREAENRDAGSGREVHAEDRQPVPDQP